jgi:hypothetical protein
MILNLICVFDRLSQPLNVYLPNAACIPYVVMMRHMCQYGTSTTGSTSTGVAHDSAFYLDSSPDEWSPLDAGFKTKLGE